MQHRDPHSSHHHHNQSSQGDEESLTSSPSSSSPHTYSHTNTHAHSHTHIPAEVYSREYAFLKKLDDRLFPEHLLYCEGMPRPAMRGVLHLLCALLCPLGFWHLYATANHNIRGQWAVIAYIGGQCFCCVVSALYHIGRFNAATEIMMQKLDHMGIAICTAGVNFPVSLLLLPRPWGALLAILSTLTCAWTCFNIAQNRPGVWRLILTAGVILPFFPLLWVHQTSVEFSAMIGNSLCMAMGAYVFTSHWPDPLPTIFGYHEVFHVFTVLGFACIYICNWSVIHRTCNPYALELDVTVLLREFLFSSNDQVVPSM